jgi:hypothetical protein
VHYVRLFLSRGGEGRGGAAVKEKSKFEKKKQKRNSRALPSFDVSLSFFPFLLSSN